MSAWLTPPSGLTPPLMVVFRTVFETREETSMDFVFSADERCELFLDGRRVADGPERGDPGHWHFQRHAETIGAGPHTLTARVLCLGKEMTAHAQTSVRHGFFLRASGELAGSLDTATARWECQAAEGITFLKPWPDWGTYPRFELDGVKYNWDILAGKGGEWLPAERFEDDRELHEPELPPMRFEMETGFRVAHTSDVIDKDAPFDSPIPGGAELPLRIPSGTSRRILVAFDDYVCAWPKFSFTGGAGATVRTRWAETLYDRPPREFNRDNLKGVKSRRDEINGKYFVGEGSSLTLPGGKVRWVEYWWRAGLCLELIVENPSEDLEISMEFHKTGYPFRMEFHAESSSPELCRLLSVAAKTLEACSHETFVDCPYYEQLQYIGDARLEALCAYVSSRDHRLPGKALRTLARPQQDDGMIFSRYPAKIDQVIPSFSLVYILMLHDFAWWRGDRAVVTGLLPAARKILAYARSHFDKEKLLELPGWVFLDWVWPRGVPPGNCALSWMFVLALEKMAELETHFGEERRAREYEALAGEVGENVIRKRFDERRGIFADDEARKEFSEHPQALALLTRRIPEELAKSLASGLRGPLTRCGIHFSHYYLEACAKQRMPDLFFERLSKWFALEGEGLKTLPEDFENTRSDCHAWSSHVLYHYFASILGVRPAAPGFAKISVSPMTGPLAFAKGWMAHPAGRVRVEVSGENIDVRSDGVPFEILRS